MFLGLVIIVFKKNWPNPASFCLFLFFSHDKFSTNTKWQKHRWRTWDSNPGQQDGRRRRIHWAMAIIVLLLFPTAGWSSHNFCPFYLYKVATCVQSSPTAFDHPRQLHGRRVRRLPRLRLGFGQVSWIAEMDWVTLTDILSDNRILYFWAFI